MIFWPKWPKFHGDSFPDLKRSKFLYISRVLTVFWFFYIKNDLFSKVKNQKKSWRPNSVSPHRHIMYTPRFVRSSSRQEQVPFWQLDNQEIRTYLVESRAHFQIIASKKHPWSLKNGLSTIMEHIFHDHRKSADPACEGQYDIVS